MLASSWFKASAVAGPWAETRSLPKDVQNWTGEFVGNEADLGVAELGRMMIADAVLNPLYAELWKDMTMLDVCEEAQRRGIVCTPILKPDEVRRYSVAAGGRPKAPARSSTTSTAMLRWLPGYGPLVALSSLTSPSSVCSSTPEWSPNRVASQALVEYR